MTHVHNGSPYLAQELWPRGDIFLAIGNITQWSSKFLAINKMRFRKPHLSNQVEAILLEMESGKLLETRKLNSFNMIVYSLISLS